LQKAGASITIRENGKLALDAALAARDQGRPFDVILMDIQMPTMSGDEAMKRLREHGYTDPIIAFTANSMDDDRQIVLRSGFDDFTTKPINATELINTIYQHWGGANEKI